MRQDQYEKLQLLEEKLLDVFLEEADPANWPGQGLKISAMDKQTRGDLYWVRKTAASAAVLRGKVLTMIDDTQQAGRTPALPAGEDPLPDGDAEGSQLDADIASAEREAQKLITEMQRSAAGPAKRAFDKKAHGRA
jgi:hypothetical protein